MLKLGDFTALLELFFGRSGFEPSQDRTQSHASAPLSADKESHTYMHRNSQHEWSVWVLTQLQVCVRGGGVGWGVHRGD